MSGGKGGSTSSSVQIPSWLEGPAKENLAKAKMASEVGYMPYYGPDVAAQNTNQLLGNQATYDAAAALGLAPQGGSANAGMPTPTNFGNGVIGYSSGDLYDQARQELADRRPGQYAMYESMFVDPMTGTTPVTFGGGTPEINQDYVSTPLASGSSNGPGENNVQAEPFMRSVVNNFGYVDPMSPKGLLANIFPGGGALLAANNALAVGSMQDLSGAENPGFLSNLFTDARDTVGTSNINDYDYTINLGGGVSKDGKTGLTPSEAAARMAFAQYDWADKIAQQQAAEQAAAQRAAEASLGYVSGSSGGGNTGYSYRPASSSSRQSSALDSGTGSGIGSGGGNASRGFSTGGW